MLKENKGITLVALVITIIVLLILAGVTISLVLGDKGILTNAKDAQKKQEMAYAEEIVGIGLKSLEMDATINAAAITNIVEALNDAIGNPNFTVTEATMGSTAKIVYTMKNGQKITVDANLSNYSVTHVSEPADPTNPTNP